MATTLSPTQMETVVAMYAAAEKRVTDHIARQLAKGLNAPDWALMKQLELQQTKRWLVSGSKSPTARAQKAYEALLADAYRGVNSGGLVHAYNTEKAVLKRIAHNTPTMMPDFTRAAMRAAEDVYREVIAAEAGVKALGATTRAEAVRSAVKNFQERGVTAFTDKAGRRWNIKTYANMAVKTGVRNSRRAAHLDRFTENGVDLIKVSKGSGPRRSGSKACDACSKWEGKILSIQGKTDGYPTLQEAESEGLHHPNCHHTVSAYFDPEAVAQPDQAKAVPKPKAKPLTESERDDIRKRHVKAQLRKDSAGMMRGTLPQEQLDQILRDAEKELAELAPRLDEAMAGIPVHMRTMVRSEKKIKEHVAFLEGLPKSPTAAKTSLKGSNPNYRLGREWQINCQRVAQAYEMRRRGYNVYALPNTGDMDGFDSLSLEAFWRNRVTGQTPEVQTVLASGSSDILTMEDLDDMFGNWWPDGARGQAACGWKGADVGHIWNWEKKDGKILFIDAQSGKTDSLSNMRTMGDSYLRRASHVEMWRIDDCEPVGAIQKAVKPA